MIKEVSIFLFLILVIDRLDIITIKIFNLFIFGVILLLVNLIMNVFIKKIGEYYRRRKLNTDFELLIEILDNELKKISSKQLRTDSSSKKKELFNDLDETLKQMTYNEILSDPQYHFENSYVINFDLINNECRGDKRSFSKKYYQTISNDCLRKNILDEKMKQKFVSSAIRSKRDDLFIEKKVIEEHFNRDEIEKKLMKSGIFLSSMKKRAFKKNTFDCKSLNF